MTIAQQYISTWYAQAREMFGVLPLVPTYRADQPEANAEAGVENGVPWFTWRDGYPSPALDAAWREREAKRTACHEIGHAFELLCLLLGIDVYRLFAEWRGFNWATWEAEGRQPREFLADAFGAALSGEWVVPIGRAEADGYRYELPTVTPQQARDFFLGLVGRAQMYIDLPSRFYSFRELPIRYIVLHTTQGTDSRTWLTETGGVSAHYLVREDKVYRLVGEDWAAWHAGLIVGTPSTAVYHGKLLEDGTWSVNPNDESIGIEVEGYAAQRLSDVAVRTTAALIADIRARRGPLPLVSHSELSPANRTDPGVDNRQRIEALLEESMTKEEFEALFLENQRKHITPTILAMKSAYDPLVAAARQNGLVDSAQEQRLAELETFVLKLRAL